MKAETRCVGLFAPHEKTLITLELTLISWLRHVTVTWDNTQSHDTTLQLVTIDIQPRASSALFFAEARLNLGRQKYASPLRLYVHHSEQATMIREH
jgi:hypothetical protein